MKPPKLVKPRTSTWPPTVTTFWKALSGTQRRLIVTAMFSVAALAE